MNDGVTLEKTVDTACMRSLETENKALRAQVAQRDQEIAAMREKIRRLNRMEKGLNIIQKWAEEQHDEFLTDLIDLIDD